MTFFKKLLFSEATPLIHKARLHSIDAEDLLPLPAELHPRTPSVPVEDLRWTTPRALLFSTLKTLRRLIGPAYLWYLANAAVSLATPVLVHRFVAQISAGVTAETLPMSLLTGILLGLCGFLAGLFMQHYFYNSLRAYQVITNILNEKIFRHSLKLSQTARQKSQLGDIVNYMSSDSDSVSDFPLIMGDLLSTLLMMTGVIVMLFYYIGISALAALMVMAVMAPLTRYIAKKFTTLDEEMMHHRDRRITLLTQALNAIRVVKYFAWEKSVMQEVTDVRDKELHSRARLARSEVISSLGYLSVSTLVLFTALAVHAGRGQPLDAALIFTCISLFGLLEGPFGDLSRLISRYTNAVVGAQRILKFLNQEQVTKVEKPLDESGRAVGLEIENMSVTYEGREQPVLTNVNFTARPGMATAIVGPVGAGKSSLLAAILGETSVTGRMEFLDLGEQDPRIAYVPQEAYIVNGTLLENLQFGETVSKEDLRRAVHNSCLSRDLKEWPAGLRTEIGEKGVNLSGGQKQRVALARAFLSRPQVVLLDDPLSAVDGQTEDLLCERLLFGAWKDRTRIVATHRLEHLAKFDEVIYLENGRVLGRGRFEDLRQDCPEFARFYAEHGKTQGEAHAVVEAEIAETTKEEITESRVTEDEDRERGAVKGHLYWDYVSSLGGDNPKTKPLILFCLFLGSVAVTILPVSQKAWWSYFSNHSAEWTPLKAVGVYGLIGVAVIIASMCNHLFWLGRGMRAGRNIHQKMLRSVLASPIRFFDSTPVGRILQRFSRDIESVDVYLQWTFDAAVNCFLQVVASLVLILGLMPLMIVVILPVMWAYYRVQKDYRRPAREAKRLDSIARSPRFAHFKESLQGLVVIRSFSKSNWFLQNFYDRLAHSQRMYYSHYMLNRWFSSRIPLIGGVISTGTAICISLSAYKGVISAGNAGLATLYSLSFWSFLNWGIRMFADIESRMTSIERLKYFANLPPEKSILKEAAALPTTWPERGEVQVQDLKVRYASHLPLVLKGLSFEAKAGTRVGIIGRTGSGKSTFFQSLFRFIEAESGCIRVDGVDIASVPLEQLRRSLAIIPQDPVLFMGTMRSNLDPYREYSPQEIQRALEHASLWDYVTSLPQGLESPVSESGLNLSQGQRQLLCLARALLTEAKVIVMDEATASVDVQTDAVLQKVLRKSFNDVTMLIIAHRLGTIADCDQIVEISAGEIKSIRRPNEFTAEEIEASLV